MQNTAILIDSTIKLDDDLLEKYDVFVVPLSINFKNVSYKEKGDLGKLTQEIFDKIQAEKEIPKTSQPAVQDFLNIYKEIESKGFTKILGFFLSSNFSGTFQGAINARNIYQENSSLEIRLYDTHSVAQIASPPIQEVLEQFSQNENSTDDQVENIFLKYSDNTTIFLLVSSLDYLALGGRINAKVAAIGNLFGITPILTIKDGIISEFAKCRSQKAAYKKIFDLFEKDTQNEKSDFKGGVLPAKGVKSPHKISHQLEKIANKKNASFSKLNTSELTPVISSHTGPGSIGICWIKVD